MSAVACGGVRCKCVCSWCRIVSEKYPSNKISTVDSLEVAGYRPGRPANAPAVRCTRTPRFLGLHLQENECDGELYTGVLRRLPCSSNTTSILLVAVVVLLLPA
jgi:hypothetical protein